MTLLLTDIIARFGVRIAMGLGVLVAFFAWDNSRVNKGRVEERAAIEKRGETNAKKADAARRAADKLPADRLRDRHCRDC